LLPGKSDEKRDSCLTNNLKYFQSFVSTPKPFRNSVRRYYFIIKIKKRRKLLFSAVIITAIRFTSFAQTAPTKEKKAPLKDQV